MSSKAEEQYNKHLQRLRNYNANHKEELKILSKQYYHNKIKINPEKYKLYLEKRKEYQKQRRIKQKEENLGKDNNILKDN